MRIFWYNGALQFLPEDKREMELLEEISRNIKFEPPLEMQEGIASGSTPLGSEGVYEVLVRDKEARPRCLSIQSHNKQLVTRIDKRP
jgi:hypothetical protein